MSNQTIYYSATLLECNKVRANALLSGDLLLMSSGEIYRIEAVIQNKKNVFVVGEPDSKILLTFSPPKP